ncbi:hypothetical protein F4558_003447 [Micromonospora profundi]|nr:hypothetical protein [Micromonospora profundi]
MRILTTDPHADGADFRTGRVTPVLIRRRHVDMMRVCSAACRGRAAH